MDKIKVLIVDDDLEWMYLIENNLSFEEDIELIGKASNGNEGMELSKELKPDIVLMDVNLTGKLEDKDSGLTVASYIINELNIKTIILSSITESDVFKNSFLLGALQYVEKRDIQGLTNIIRTCYRTVNPMHTLISELNRLKKEELLCCLSTEERRIFGLFKDGLSYKKIEEKLVKSRNTLRNQIKSINKKMFTKSIHEAVLKVEKNGTGIK